MRIPKGRNSTFLRKFNLIAGQLQYLQQLLILLWHKTQGGSDVLLFWSSRKASFWQQEMYLRYTSKSMRSNFKRMLSWDLAIRFFFWTCQVIFYFKTQRVEILVLFHLLWTIISKVLSKILNRKKTSTHQNNSCKNIISLEVHDM